MLRSYKKRLRDAILSGDTMNVTEFYGTEATMGGVMEAIETPPFFSERRVVIVESSAWMSPKKKAPDEEGSKEKGREKADTAPFLEALSRMPDSTVLIFVEEKVDKRNGIFKKIADMGYCALLDHPPPEEIKSWAAMYLQKAGKKITVANMDRFFEYVGSDMEFVRGELEKLIVYTGDRDVIEHSDLDCITMVLSEAHIFKLVDAIVAGQKSLAARYYRALFINNEPPMRMIILITKRFQRLLSMKELLLKGEDMAAVKKALSLNWAEERLLSKVRGYDRNVLRNHVLQGLFLEREIKGGRINERLALELLLTGEYEGYGEE